MSYKHKHRGNRRMVRIKAVRGRERILIDVYNYTDDEIAKVLGSLDERMPFTGSVRSTKLRKSRYAGSGTVHYNGRKWYSASDQRKFDAVQHKLAEGYDIDNVESYVIPDNTIGVQDVAATLMQRFTKVI